MKGPDKEKFPECIKVLLIAAGFDTAISLKQMSEPKIVEIEKFLNENKQFVQKFKCCHSDHYKQLDIFTFLSGHRSIILTVPDKLNSNKTMKKTRIGSNEELKQNLIKNLMACSGKAGFQFPEGIISESNIENFERVIEDNLVCKCQFICPFCPKSFPLKFRKFWEPSNATKHLKSHIAEQSHEQSK